MADDVPPLLVSDWGGIGPDTPPSRELWARVWPRLVLRYAELATQKVELERARAEVKEARGMAQAAARTEKGRAQFIANLSHELRTPLNAILGYSDLMREELSDRGEAALVEDVSRIDLAGRTLLGLINDVIDLAKIDAGRMKLVPERFDVSQVVADAVEHVRSARPGARVQVELSPDLGAVSSDAARLRQCVEYLVQRAVSASPTEPVEVLVRREGPAVNVRVRDHGEALSPEQQIAVFSEFADASPQRADGAGLGLALCRRLVELMGGAVDVVSGAGGTTFTIRIPDQDAARTPAALQLAAAAERMSPNDPRTVLVIDDDPDMQEVVGRILAKEGYRVAGAADGERGVLLARRLRPRAILLDLILPGRSGWDVLSRLKADPELASIPVVVLSTIDDRTRGIALGADEYLVKPVDRDQLIASVHRYIRGGDVLIVEDDAATRAVLRTMLERAGVRVRLAAHGAEGLALLEQEAPGLVLLDLMMPVMDGFAFLREVRANPAWRTLPIVIMTAKDLSPDEIREIEASVARVMTKHGHNLDEVLSQVVSLVRG
jgi:signal transduction histidine kinase/DNA-binding response OmpR family regulator